MAKKEVEYLSKNAYALYLGISEKAIRNAIAQGKIKKGYDIVKQKVIKHLADKEFGHLHKVVKPRAGVSKDKLAERLKSEESPKKNTQSSDKSERNSVSVSISEKSEQKSKKSKKSEDESEEEDDFEFLLDEGLTVDQLIKKLTVTSEMSYAEATRRREVIQLAVDKNKLEEQHGTLVRKSDVEKVLFTFGAQIKKSLMAIPVRVADELLHSESKVDIINILNTELTQTLTAFANFEDLKLDK